MLYVGVCICVVYISVVCRNVELWFVFIVLCGSGCGSRYVWMHIYKSLHVRTYINDLSFPFNLFFLFNLLFLTPLLLPTAISFFVSAHATHPIVSLCLCYPSVLTLLFTSTQLYSLYSLYYSILPYSLYSTIHLYSTLLSVLSVLYSIRRIMILDIRTVPFVMYVSKMPLRKSGWYSVCFYVGVCLFLSLFIFTDALILYVHVYM